MENGTEHPIEPAKGFVIHCNDGVSVSVSSTQALKMQEQCEYFRSMFQHGTLEAETRTIVKDDWSSTVARQLIDLITAEIFAATFEDLEDFNEFATAADQVLYDLRLISPFDASIMSKEQTEKVTELSHASYFAFSIEMYETPSVKKWQELLNDGILLSIDWKVLVAVGVASGNEMVASRLQWYTHANLGKKFRVYTKDTFTALQSLCPPPAPPKHSWPFPDVKLSLIIDENVRSQVNAKVAQTTGLQLGPKTISGWCELSGPVQMLARAFPEIRRYLTSNKVVFTIGYKENGLLNVFMNSVLDCEDDKGTLCYVKSDGSFRAEKTIADASIILKQLAKNIPSMEVQFKGRFRIGCLESYPPATKNNFDILDGFARFFL